MPGLPPEQQAALQERLQELHADEHLRPRTRTVTIDPVRAAAFDANLAHYTDVFTHGRDEYAIPPGALSDPDKLRQLSAFFFWTSWAASTNRPGDDHHLHEQLAARAAGRQSPDRRRGRLDRRQHHHAARRHRRDGLVVRVALASTGCRPRRPRPIPLLGSVATPSQRAVVKYFWVVSALILVQILMGVVTAHYGVEGDGFYGIPARRAGCRTASPARGTSSSASSGSPRHGWPPVCSSVRR